MGLNVSLNVDPKLLGSTEAEQYKTKMLKDLRYFCSKDECCCFKCDDVSKISFKNNIVYCGNTPKYTYVEEQLANGKSNNYFKKIPDE